MLAKAVASCTETLGIFVKTMGIFVIKPLGIYMRWMTIIHIACLDHGIMAYAPENTVTRFPIHPFCSLRMLAPALHLIAPLSVMKLKPFERWNMSFLSHLLAASMTPDFPLNTHPSADETHSICPNFDFDLITKSPQMMS